MEFLDRVNVTFVLSTEGAYTLPGCVITIGSMLYAWGLG